MDLVTENGEDAHISEEYLNAIAAANGINLTQSGSSGDVSIITLIVDDIGRLFGAAGDLIDELTDLDFFGMLDAAADAFDAVTDLVYHIELFITEMVLRIAELVLGAASEAYQKLLFTTYVVYSVPNRTNYLTGYSMTGSSYRNIEYGSPSPGGDIPVFGAISAIVDAIKAGVEGTGDDITFCGAELEYILFGSKSEILNQTFAFLSLWLFRLLLDIPALCMNQEVQAMATAAGPFCWVVWLVEIAVEPFVDTVILVNGGEVALYKQKIFLTPSGIPDLIGEITNFSLNASQKTALKTKAQGIANIAGQDFTYSNPSGVQAYASGLLKLDYEQHLMILMLFFSRETMLRRMCDIIQSEAISNAQASSYSWAFDLEESYTYIRSEVSFDMRQFLPIVSLDDFSPFSTTRLQYRGY